MGNDDDDDDESILNLLCVVKSVAGDDSMKKEKYYNVQCLAVIVWALSTNCSNLKMRSEDELMCSFF